VKIIKIAALKWHQLLLSVGVVCIRHEGKFLLFD